MEPDPKRVITWVLTIVVPIGVAYVFVVLITFFAPSDLIAIGKEHFAAVVGLPLSALLSAFIVIGLRHTDGPMKFEGLGFKFEGASGQVVLWVFCFLAISFAIKLLW